MTSGYGFSAEDAPELREVNLALWDLVHTEDPEVVSCSCHPSPSNRGSSYNGESAMRSPVRRPYIHIYI